MRKMKLLLNKNDASCYDDKAVRQGLRLRFEPGVDCEVKRAIKEYSAWLRKNYRFPIRVAVYVKAAERIKARDGDLVCGTCFCPYDKLAEPYIRLATGDYEVLQKKHGKDNALASLICCMTHELVHYYQWINDSDKNDTQAERQASYYSDKLLAMYSAVKEHP